MVAKDVRAQKRKQDIANQLRQISASLLGLADLLSEQGVPEAENRLLEKLKEELGTNLRHVDVIASSASILIRPKRFLEKDVFRLIADIARRNRGRWDSNQKCFVVPLVEQNSSRY